ncbi:zinc finger protein 462-like [Schistocerca nitens]|uniref:zinc finger protein 462-like n=1 Tax=Schistocerca nitens TaxID=7011 RepID=UPI002117B74A|nr:zinc finger protein 462-like [Schistocerca nitens]
MDAEDVAAIQVSTPHSYRHRGRRPPPQQDAESHHPGRSQKSLQQPQHNRQRRRGDHLHLPSCPTCYSTQDRDDCPDRWAQCTHCGREAHLASVCRAKTTTSSNRQPRPYPDGLNNTPMHINQVDNSSTSKFFFGVTVNDKPLRHQSLPPAPPTQQPQPTDQLPGPSLPPPHQPMATDEDEPMPLVPPMPPSQPVRRSARIAGQVASQTQVKLEYSADLRRLYKASAAAVQPVPRRARTSSDGPHRRS